MDFYKCGNAKCSPYLVFHNILIVKFIIAIIVVYFIYRFFVIRQRHLTSKGDEELDIGEYIDYEEIEDEE